MTDKDDSHHPRLLLLHESDGEIQGRKKYSKLVRMYEREAGDETKISTIREDRGPHDKGLSRTMRRYVDSGLVETDDEGKSRDVKETEKGERYMSGFEKAKRRLDSSFQKTKERAFSVISEHGDKSGTELEEELSDDKENAYGREYR